MNRFNGAGVSGGASPSGQPRREIVGAIVVILCAAERLVAPPVAGGEQGVVDPARGVLDQGQDPSALVGDERVADPGNDPPDRYTAVLHRHELAHVVGIERPGVDDLLPRELMTLTLWPLRTCVALPWRAGISIIPPLHSG